MEGGRRRLFCFAMQSRRRRKKVVAGRCGDKIERTPTSSSFGQTKPIGFVLGVAFANAMGMITGYCIVTVIACNGSITVALALPLADVVSPTATTSGQGIGDHPSSRMSRIKPRPACDYQRRYFSPLWPTICTSQLSALDILDWGSKVRPADRVEPPPLLPSTTGPSEAGPSPEGQTLPS